MKDQRGQGLDVQCLFDELKANGCDVRPLEDFLKKLELKHAAESKKETGDEVVATT